MKTSNYIDQIPKEMEDGAAYRCSIHPVGSRSIDDCPNDAIGILKPDLAEMLANWSKNDREFRKDYFVSAGNRFTFICEHHHKELFGELNDGG